MNRRTFLKSSIGASAGLAIASNILNITISHAKSVDTPDANNFTKPTGWGVCLGKDAWEAYGMWVPEKTLELFKPKCWHSWASWPEYYGHAGGIPMVWSSRWFIPDMVRRRMQARDGEVWQIVNEPDNPAQANESPEQTVDTTLALIEIGQAAGNDWQWTSPAIMLDTEHNGLGWMTEYMRILRRKKGIMSPAYWTIHPYTCNTVERLRNSMAKWWAWYAIWGHSAPVIISEGCAEDGDVNMQKRVMDEFRRMLDDGEVQGVMWFQAYRMVDDRRLDAKLSHETHAWAEAQRRSIPWDHYHLGVLHHETQEIEITDLGEHWRQLQ